jgi:chromosomal replication initiator protein
MQDKPSWPHIQAKLSLIFSSSDFDHYLKNTALVSWQENTLIIEAPDGFRRDWLNQHSENILAVTRDLCKNADLNLIFKIAGSNIDDHKLQTEEKVIITTPLEQRITPITTGFTFNNFIVGPSNRFAQAACQAVAEKPAQAYNPLVLYGGVGLGKTHLLHAIANTTLALYPNSKLLYITSENFMNEMIAVLRSGGDMKLFRDKFRSADILLIDDIQFLAGKESTQEEFFHTFNDLHSHGKQIVATCDIPPREIHLDERLRNRFEWGLVADIGRPDFETRMAILRKKASQDKKDVSDEVLEFLARTFTANIRELEGALIKIFALSSILNKEISLELAQEALRDVLKSQTRPVSIELIQEIVTQRYHLKMSDMKARKRTDAIAFPRQIAMFLSRELTSSSLPEIGSAFGGRDHTTVIHAINKIEAKSKQDPELAAIIESLIQQIKGIA